MGIFDLFSKRQKRLNKEIPDVFTYDKIPTNLRIQIVHIWNDVLGTEKEFFESRYGVKGVYDAIVNVLRREYGMFHLTGDSHNDNYSYIELINFFLKVEDTERAIDVIELSFRYADTIARQYVYKYDKDSSKSVDNSILELNARFKEHGIGYEYSDGEIIRIDSQLIHVETVKPALKLLNGKGYAGAQEEFLKAYEHFRQGNNKEALNDALKAFESTMKAICDKRKWAYDATVTSKRLIEICYENKLVPSFWQEHMAALRSLLEAGVPTGRNKLSGHGQGTIPIEVPEHIVAYVLHMTASAIVFLVKSEEEL